MSEEKDGGPAFPLPDQYTPHGDPVVQGAHGMSLRDWFAGQAPGLSAPAPRATAEALAGSAPDAFDERSPENMRLWFEWWARADAAARYIQADAMLAARKNTYD